MKQTVEWHLTSLDLKVTLSHAIVILLNSSSVNYFLSAILTFLTHCCDCINTSVNSVQYLHFNFVQQCIQISTRINSTSVHMYICVCFFQNVSNIQHCWPLKPLWYSVHLHVDPLHDTVTMIVTSEMYEKKIQKSLWQRLIGNQYHWHFENIRCYNVEFYMCSIQHNMAQVWEESPPPPWHPVSFQNTIILMHISAM